MAIAATILSIVSFFIFLVLAIVAFMAYGDVDTQTCIPQRQFLLSAEQYLLGVGILNIIMMIIVVFYIVINYKNLFTRGLGLNASFIFFTSLYLVSFVLTCVLSALAYSNLVRSGCVASTLPQANNNTLGIMIGSGLLAVVYIIVLIVAFRSETQNVVEKIKLPGSSSTKGQPVVKTEKQLRQEQEKLGKEVARKISAGEVEVIDLTNEESAAWKLELARRKQLLELEESAKNLVKREPISAEEKRKQGDKLLKMLEEGQDISNISPEESNLIEDAIKRREKISQLQKRLKGEVKVETERPKTQKRIKLEPIKIEERMMPLFEGEEGESIGNPIFIK